MSERVISFIIVIMKEVFTEAIVLDREDLREADSRIFLYTENFGKIIAKAKSARKITSKLSAHLEPLNLIQVRLVASKDFQVVDSLRVDRLKPEMLSILRLVKEISTENYPDQFLWQVLKRQYLQSSEPKKLAQQILAIAGFDPSLATCHSCQAGKPDNFLINSTEYLCTPCLSGSAGSERYFRLQLSD